MELGHLAERFGTDKGPSGHDHTAVYEWLLRRRRDKPITLVEIGVGGYADVRAGGASLRMWDAWLTHPDARIIGVDRTPKAFSISDRVTLIRADQGSRADMTRLGEAHGPFDVVIDDGSHRSSDVITSLEVLFEFLTPGGVYVIEDVQTSYWEEFNASEPVRHMDYLKGLCDGVNYLETRGRIEPTKLETLIDEITFRHNMVIVEKMTDSGTKKTWAQLDPESR